MGTTFALDIQQYTHVYVYATAFYEAAMIALTISPLFSLSAFTALPREQEVCFMTVSISCSSTPVASTSPSGSSIFLLLLLPVAASPPNSSPSLNPPAGLEPCAAAIACAPNPAELGSSNLASPKTM